MADKEIPPRPRLEDIAGMMSVRDIALSMSGLHNLVSGMASKVDAVAVGLASANTRLETTAIRLDGIVGQLADHETRMRQVERAVIAINGLPQWQEKIDRRISALERWRYGIPGSLLVGAAGIALALINRF